MLKRISREQIFFGKHFPLYCMVALSFFVTTTSAQFTYNTNDIALTFNNNEFTMISSQLSQAKSGSSNFGMWRNNEPSLRYKYLDSNCLYFPGDNDPLDVVLRRTSALLENLKPNLSSSQSTTFTNQFNALKSEAAGVNVSNTTSRKDIYDRACKLRRQIAFANPLLNFDSLIFISAHGGLEGFWQNVGFSFSNPGAGNGLHIISNWKNQTATCQKVLKSMYPDPTETTGRQYYFGGFHANIDLSYDAKTVYFAAKWKTQNVQIFKIGIDGNGFTPLTPSTTKSAYPCLLPNGRIVYGSQVAQKGDRCEGTTTTLCSMAGDGSDSYEISWHETPEYNPVVCNDGMLAYGRWDYVERSFNAAQGLWTCYPDGRDPRAAHGNYPYPHYTLDGCTGGDGRADRPWSELHIMPIPNASNEFIAIAGIHHGPLPGTPVIIDLKVPDDNQMSQVRMICGTCLPNEVEYNYCKGVHQPRCSNGEDQQNRNFFTPYPLSRDYYLISTRDALLLLDRFGNREVIFKPSNGVPNALSPRPIVSRKAPPVLSTQTWQGKRYNLPDHKRATISITNIYESDFIWPVNTKIKSLRIIQLTPRHVSESQDTNAGYAQQSGRVNTKAVIGTVPVEEDGSVYCEAPVGRLLYFQALDSNGLAIQSMRSGTYVHPGEQLSCFGCHEDKYKMIKPPAKVPIALSKRIPATIKEDVAGSNPMNFYILVNPIFQNKCLPCHVKENKGIKNFTYDSLSNYAFWYDAKYNGLGKHGGHRSWAGRVGARESKMGKVILSTHTSRLTKEEIHRVTLWLDAGSPRLGSFHNVEEQVVGKVVWPLVEVDSLNPTGIERQFPLCAGSDCATGVNRPNAFVKNLDPTFSYMLSKKILYIYSSSGNICKLDLYRIDGKLAQSISVNQSRVKIDISHLNAGTYILRYRNITNANKFEKIGTIVMK